MDGDKVRDTHWNTVLNSLGSNEKQKEGELEQGRRDQREPHLMMDGDRDRDPHWNTGLNSLGPNEKQKEGECEQGRQDQREPSPGDGWRLRQSAQFFL